MDLNDFKPCFLVAMPELTDPNFAKTVILMTDFNKKGASGFVINKKTDIDLGGSIVLPDGSLNPDYNDLTLWYGGPVEPDKIWIIYDGTIHEEPQDHGLGDEIKIAHDIDILINHEQTLDPTKLKVLHGFSGWSAGQLDGEIALNSWITSPLSKDLLFNVDEKNVWEQAIRNLGFDPSKLKGINSAFIN
ncbi:YqgE/AlgH family protein [bacterium]|nr:YqgE/AlgH family protein [bacterium]MBU1918678.1 YqgE/AlgH family protein [bacterium]